MISHPSVEELIRAAHVLRQAQHFTGEQLAMIEDYGSILLHVASWLDELAQQRARRGTTANDLEALDSVLVLLRDTDREILERASTQLVQVAAAQFSRHADPTPMVPPVLVLLARIAYVLAHEGERG